MADYFAVLQRTLSGFSEPKPELRIKLYERARSTIERQLAGRNPPVTGEALDAELKRLEQAIVDIERQYDPTFEAIETAARPEPEPAAPEPKPEPATPAAAPAVKAEPAAPAAKPEPAAAPAVKPEPAAPAAKPEPAAASAVKAEPAASAAKPEPAAAPAVKAEPAAPVAKPEPAAAPAVKAEPAAPVAKPEPAAAPAVKAEPAAPEAKPEPAAAPAVKPEPAAPEAKPEPAAAKAEPAAPEVKPEAVAANAKPAPTAPTENSKPAASKVEPAAKPESAVAPTVKTEPAASEAKPEPAAAKAEPRPAAKPEVAVPPTVKIEPATPPAPEPKPIAPPSVKIEPAAPPAAKPNPEPKPEPASPPPIPIFEPPAPESVDRKPAPAKKPTPLADQEASSAESAVDPVEEWAKEFLAIEPARTPAPQPAQVSVDENVSAADENGTQIFEQGSPLVPQVPESETLAKEIPAAHDLPPFESNADSSLGIPPAPGFSPKTPRRSKKRGGLKWLLLLILLAAIAAAGYFGWQSRTTLIDTLGLNKWFVDSQDPQTPKKVKTITIKPDPVEPESDPVSPTNTKSETRIPAQGTATGPDKVEIKPVPVNGAPPVAQSAVLYEEGATTADSSIDRGRVVWSVVQKAPVEGLPAEPAIQGRVEVPSRNLVLNMTIKRNADKSLPASHVIELNFTVPSDFSGGAIGQIRSLVFKSSEQGQGSALIGVPVQLTEGQFILALNNLESAQKSNVELIKDSGWIDVPMLYRTGRRAFITIEKGAPGEKVFDEVLAAWAQ